MGWRHCCGTSVVFEHSGPPGAGCSAGWSALAGAQTQAAATTTSAAAAASTARHPASSTCHAVAAGQFSSSSSPRSAAVEPTQRTSLPPGFEAPTCATRGGQQVWTCGWRSGVFLGVGSLVAGHTHPHTCDNITLAVALQVLRPHYQPAVCV